MGGRGEADAIIDVREDRVVMSDERVCRNVVTQHKVFPFIDRSRISRCIEGWPSSA